MQAYLFVHFKEKTTPDGEQVYFGISKDGFNWEKVKDGLPILWTYYGDKGARDFTIVRSKLDKHFYIFGTDLSLSYGMRNQYHNSWNEISKNGSNKFSVWQSENLVDWTEQKLIKIGNDDFGCMWAPDILYDETSKEYILHWSSSHKSDNYNKKAIYYSRTKDFDKFTNPKLLYKKEDSSVIDSAIYREKGKYYMFVKSEKDPAGIILLVSDKATGPYKRIYDFDKSMEQIEEGVYEAPTAVRLENGKWVLFLDYYGLPGSKQGYVPFIADSLVKGQFKRSDKAFSFPYGFKHGTILKITMEEYKRIKNNDWSDS